MGDWKRRNKRSLQSPQAATVDDRSVTAGKDRHPTTRSRNMDEHQLRNAYAKTAMHRIGVPFERAVAIVEVRRALEASARRSKPQAAQPAQASGR